MVEMKRSDYTAIIMVDKKGVCRVGKIIHTVFLVEDDEIVRDAMVLLLESAGYKTLAFPSATLFLDFHSMEDRGCLVLDIGLPGMSGIQLQEALIERNSTLPVIFVTGQENLPMAVEAMRRGAVDFIKKPIKAVALLERIGEALVLESKGRDERLEWLSLKKKIALFTARELEVFDLLAIGKPNKLVAFELEISERTVEAHRANLVKKLEAGSLADIVKAKILLER